jgi:hypothetical protein
MSQRLTMMGRTSYLFFVLGLWFPMLAQATDDRTDVTAGAFSPPYYTSVNPTYTWYATGSGLLPSHTYSIHNQEDGSVFVQFHTDSSGNITDSGAVTVGVPGGSGALIGNSCTAGGTPVCEGVGLSGWTATNHMAAYADDGSVHVPASGGVGAVTCLRRYYPGPCPGIDCPPSPQPSSTVVNHPITFTIGSMAATTPVTVSLSVPEAIGGGAYPVQVIIGTGWTGTFSVGPNSSTQSTSISAALSAILEGGGVTINTSILGDAYAVAVPHRKIHITMSAPPVFHAGVTLTVLITGTYADVPTATPSPTATAAPSATIPPSPAPSATPTATPLVPNPTPALVPNAQDTAVTNGTSSTITNQDMYNDVKQAVQDSGNGHSPGTAEQGQPGHGGNPDYGRGHLDDLEGQVEGAAATKATIIGEITGWYSLLNASIATLPHSFGNAVSITMNLDVLGNAPDKGKISLPRTISLIPFIDIISAVRATLLWLLRLAFWTATVRLFALGV